MSVWHRKNRARVRQHQAAWRAKHPEQKKRIQRKYELKKFYGLTLEEYDAMLEAQGGVCAICAQAPDGENLCVDHDHKTGKNRGLVCRGCNIGIAAFGENPGTILAAERYIQFHNKQRLLRAV